MYINIKHTTVTGALADFSWTSSPTAGTEGSIGGVLPLRRRVTGTARQGRAGADSSFRE